MKSLLAYPVIEPVKLPFAVTHHFVLRETGVPRRFATAQCAAMSAYASKTTFVDERTGERYDWQDVLMLSEPHR